MEKNKSVPDIERLQHHDFDLDVDEQQRLQSIGDAEVQKVNTWPFDSLYMYFVIFYA